MPERIDQPPEQPTPVADEAAARAWKAIPAGVEGNTHGVQARVLRGAARGLR